MRRPIVALAALLLLVVACSDDEDPPFEASDATCPADLARTLDQWNESGFSGVVAVETEGSYDCRHATGSGNTIDTVFGIGSVSKAFTAVAVQSLVDAGTFALGDRAGDLVPGLTGPVADATVQQLLDHTSGLLGSHADDQDEIDHDTALAAIGALELAFPPGTDELYSNAGYTLLAMIVEATSGTTFQDYVRANVLVDGEGDFTTAYWATAGNGDIAMTVPQLADWADAHPPTGDAPPGWAAFDAELFGVPFYATAGGGGDTGVDTAVAYVPEGDIVIAMASDANSDFRAEDLLRAIGPALATGEDVPAPDEPVDVDPEVLEDAAGDYPEIGFTVEVDGDDGLRITATTPEAVAELFPRPEGADEHEAAVEALLRGETGPGRDELEALAEDLGEVTDVDVLGTFEAESELRTYVLLTTSEGDGDRQLAWYALNDSGGIEGVELTDEYPTLRLVPAPGGRFVPDDPTATGPDVSVRFTDGEIVVD